MSNAFMRNAERYYDPTVGIALTNIERMERMDWKPGDIITASRDTTEKKFIVLANDGYVLTGAVLLTKEYDTFVPIICGGKMYANPYRLGYLNPNNYDLSLVRTATDAELTALRSAIARVLSLTTPVEAADIAQGAVILPKLPESSFTDDYIEMVENQAKELIEAQTEARVFRNLYEKLLEKMTA